MSTVHKFPVSQLPAQLRDDFKDDQLVTVTIESDDTAFPHLSDSKYVELFAESDLQKERGQGTVCETPEDFQNFFSGIKARASARNKPK